MSPYARHLGWGLIVLGIGLFAIVAYARGYWIALAAYIVGPLVVLPFLWAAVVRIERRRAHNAWWWGFVIVVFGTWGILAWLRHDERQHLEPVATEQPDTYRTKNAQP